MNRLLLAVALAQLLPAAAGAESIWVEGEKPARANVSRHPWWYDQVKRDLLSGGDFISHWDAKRPGELEYRFRAGREGEYAFWVRANTTGTRLAYKLNGGAWTDIDLQKGPLDSVNIAGDGKIDVRFLSWVKVGNVALTKGENVVLFKMDSQNNHHGMLDCFVFTTEPFQPRGSLKPGQVAAVDKQGSEAGWFAFAAEAENFKPGSAIDLRYLNEKEAGENGRIGVQGAQFIHSRTGQPVRFWAVNGPSSKDPDGLRQEARLLARYGVNLARVHHGYYDDKGKLDPARVQQALDVVAALKAEGIYCHFSIYFPLWLRPAPDTAWLPGYDGKQHPFAALYFNHDFQAHYRDWWKALLLTPHARTGKRLVDDPAVFGLEIINEDSYFFWTFSDKNIPDAELRLVEKQYGDWLTKKYGSLAAAAQAWQGQKAPRDNFAEGRAGFRPLWNMANERSRRDKDAAHFLLDSQRGFYKETYGYLRGLGFQGLITCSNWATADPKVFGPLEKYSYTVGDFIDRHGYFGGRHEGEHAGWSIRNGHTYADRSALRFDAAMPGKPRLFVHPAMDPSYNGKPSMISETTWERPNRYRPEAPLYLAAYGALQDSDAIVHFAQDGARWTVKPGYFMQPWTLMTPAMMGQFPATALLYRRGLVTPGEQVANVNLKIADLLDLRGTPLPQDAALDELRLKDVPQGTELKPGSVIDPLIFYVGRTNVDFSADGGPTKLQELSKFIDRERRTVQSSTGELRLDYGRGVLTVNAPAAQGLSGDLRQAGRTTLRDLVIESDLDVGTILVVSLDGRPLATSQKMLLQVMSEEKSSDFQTEPADMGLKRITNIGHDPWLVRELQGSVHFHRADAAQLKATPLDPSGHPSGSALAATDLRLQPRTLYYLITP
jgi:hypothetical protein